jgi:uncharacterized membrane protein
LKFIWALIAAILTFLIIASPRSNALPNPRLIALLWIIVLIALIVLLIKDARERWGRKIAFVSIALVLCYWTFLGLVHSRAIAQGSEEAAKMATANGETVARLAAMPRLANPFRWDCVFETDRAMYRFELGLMDDRRRQPVRYAKPAPELLNTVSQQRPDACFLNLRRFPVMQLAIRVAPLALSFNWRTCVTLNRADRAAALHFELPIDCPASDKEMNETKEFNSLPHSQRCRKNESALAEVDDCKRTRLAGPYLALAGVMSFRSALMLRADYDSAALILIASACLIVPVFALSDRIAPLTAIRCDARDHCHHSSISSLVTAILLVLPRL